MIDHRPAHACHQFAIGHAINEAGLGQILRTDKRHPVVEHRNLAMVAQIHAAAATPAQAARQYRQHLHATVLQALAVATQAALGAHRIQQHATTHAARAGAFQRHDHRLAHRIVEHQVVQQVHTFVGRVDRRDQGLQRLRIVVEQFHRVAQRGHEIAFAFDQRHHFGTAGVCLGHPAQRMQGQLLFANHLRGSGLAPTRSRDNHGWPNNRYSGRPTTGTKPISSSQLRAAPGVVRAGIRAVRPGGSPSPVPAAKCL